MDEPLPEVGALSRNKIVPKTVVERASEVDSAIKIMKDSMRSELNGCFKDFQKYLKDKPKVQRRNEVIQIEAVCISVITSVALIQINHKKNVLFLSCANVWIGRNDEYRLLFSANCFKLKHSRSFNQVAKVPLKYGYKVSYFYFFSQQFLLYANLLGEEILNWSLQEYFFFGSQVSCK